MRVKEEITEAQRRFALLSFEFQFVTIFSLAALTS